MQATSNRGSEKQGKGRKEREKKQSKCISSINQTTFWEDNGKRRVNVHKNFYGKIPSSENCSKVISISGFDILQYMSLVKIKSKSKLN